LNPFKSSIALSNIQFTPYSVSRCGNLTEPKHAMCQEAFNFGTTSETTPSNAGILGFGVANTVDISAAW
jgi:hypothetical protein